MSVFVSDNAVPLSIPETKVSVCHEVRIVWPDGVQEQITHLEDVTLRFRNPANAGRHALLVASLMMSRVNTRLDFRLVPLQPEQPQPKRRGWLDWWRGIMSPRKVAQS